MSEDARTSFDGWGPQPFGRRAVFADSEAIARLIEAAGWTAVRDDAHTGGGIFAFDWRVAVPAAAAIDRLATDSAILAFVSLETLDAADAMIAERTARLIVGDGPALIAAELSDLAALLQADRTFDHSRDERARLQALALELARLAEQLGSLSATGDGGDDGGAELAEGNLSYRAEPSAPRARHVPPPPQRIRQLISMRRLRDRFFGGELFADPAWDILLDLAASRLEGKDVSVSSLCIAAAVPPTTALRWIRMMTERQLLERRADPADARRMFVELSSDAFDQLCGWFALVEARGGKGV